MSEIHTHGRREFLKRTGAVLGAAGCWKTVIGAAQLQDSPSVHGMLVVGQQTVFLSHLPIFGTPHDYQVILEATFAKAGSNPQADYFDDRRKTGTKVYTLEPDRFVLPRLVSDTPLRSFTANIYRGHFERFPSVKEKDAARIGQKVDVNVTRVIHFRKFDADAQKPSELEYLLFGKGSERFLAHMITKPPDFDHILAVTSPGQAFTDDALSRGLPLRFSGKKNSVANRISGAQALTARTIAADGTASATVQIKPGTEFYFEADELEA
jgi:hypothetical protein